MPLLAGQTAPHSYWLTQWPSQPLQVKAEGCWSLVLRWTAAEQAEKLAEKLQAASWRTEPGMALQTAGSPAGLRVLACQGLVRAVQLKYSAMLLACPGLNACLHQPR